jgi:hypothetical protein
MPGLNWEHESRNARKARTPIPRRRGARGLTAEERDARIAALRVEHSLLVSLANRAEAAGEPAYAAALRKAVERAGQRREDLIRSARDRRRAGSLPSMPQ